MSYVDEVQYIQILNRVDLLTGATRSLISVASLAKYVTLSLIMPTLLLVGAVFF